MRLVLATFSLLLMIPATAAALPVIDVVRAVAPEGDRPTRVVVQASDPSGAVVNSVRVDRADGTGSFAESSCGVSRNGRYNPPGGSFEVPVPGDPSGDVSVSVGTGACAPGAPPPQKSEPQGFTLRLPQPGELLPTLPPLPTPPTLPTLPKLPIARAAQAPAPCANTDVQIAAATVKKVRRAIICLVNVERRAAGVRRVKSNKRLQRAGTAHARDMRRRSYFAHEHPSGPDLVTRLQRARFWPATAGENLGASTGAFANARAIVDAWMHSTGHKANMLDKRFKWVGVGIVPEFPDPPSAPGATIAAEFGVR